MTDEELALWQRRTNDDGHVIGRLIVEVRRRRAEASQPCGRDDCPLLAPEWDFRPGKAPGEPGHGKPCTHPVGCESCTWCGWRKDRINTSHSR